MRIAVWHNLPSGGGKRALYNHIRILKDQGHYLKAWTTDMSSADFLPLSEIIPEKRKEVKESFERLNRIRNPLTRQQRLIRLMHNHCIECSEEIHNEKFDILFAGSCVFSYMPYIGMYIKIPKILYLGEPHRFLYEAMPENIWQAPYFTLKARKIPRILRDFWLNYSRRIRVLKEIEAAKSYDKILVNSLFSRENVIRAYGVDASPCLLGIDTQKFNIPVIKKDSYVVGIGKISYLKCVHKAIEILSLIPSNNRPSIKWISNGADLDYLEEMISLSQKKGVDFIIYTDVPDHELAEIVSKAAIMIYTPQLEPFGLAPLEANACGTYVVAIAEGGIRESITDGVNGCLIHGNKMKEFADVITRFTGDLSFALEKGLEARQFVTGKWTMNFMAENLITELGEFESR